MRILKAIGYNCYIDLFSIDQSGGLQSAPDTAIYAIRSKGVTDAARLELIVVLEQILAFSRSVRRAAETLHDFY